MWNGFVDKGHTNNWGGQFKETENINMVRWRHADSESRFNWIAPIVEENVILIVDGVNCFAVDKGPCGGIDGRLSFIALGGG